MNRFFLIMSFFIKIAVNRFVLILFLLTLSTIIFNNYSYQINAQLALILLILIIAFDGTFTKEKKVFKYFDDSFL